MYCICAHNGDMTEEDLNRELEKGYADIRQSRNRDIDAQLKQTK